MKPPYQVMTMAEIRALPWNGYTVASTFSGGGGSSLGYRMAGFRVAYANEFVAAARDTYRANARPGTHLDGRDIREVTGGDVLAACGVERGGLDLLDGSPPCASFSSCGARERLWGTVRKYSDTAQRTDDLFFEYARLLGEIQPKAFIAENVAGLIRGTAKGYFQEIMRALKGCGYRVEARLLDAQWLGVPQTRRRLVVVGVREDLNRQPVHPKPLAYRYSIREALPWDRNVVARRIRAGEHVDGDTALTLTGYA
jgi:DNA (cytosine-5)-methyltransferase 1